MQGESGRKAGFCQAFPATDRHHADGISTDASSLDDFDRAVFDALREWRKQKAGKMGGIPAYLIYPDRTLQELARLKPQDEAALLEVKGIGPAKAKRYGAETLAVISGGGG